MKISTMLKREDFYAINEKTLNAYFGNQAQATKLYIYPHLNAIITKHPSKSVKEYLLSEYSIRGNLLKRIAARFYVRLCMFSKGILASRTIDVSANVRNSTLIYPCNQKYRVFDFDKKYVDVVVKSGFSNKSLLNEIEFRKENNLSFVLPIMSDTESSYRELIIDGVPIARREDEDALKQAVYCIWKEIQNEKMRTVSTGEYFAIKKAAFLNMFDCDKVLSHKNEIIDLIKKIECRVSDKTVDITISHGDLQSGNVWIENKTSDIYIIDWETWSERAVKYDYAVLFGNLRRFNGITNFWNNDETRCDEKLFVLLEDLLYRTELYVLLPNDYGKLEFQSYMDEVSKCLK